MFDNEFDPLEQLRVLNYQVEELQQAFLQETATITDMGEAIKHMVDKINELISKFNERETQLIDLHNRIRLLEVIRENDTRKNI